MNPQTLIITLAAVDAVFFTLGFFLGWRYGFKAGKLVSR